MKIVLDIGCARYGGDYSIERLVEEFQPERLYGFDPNLHSNLYRYVLDDTDVVLRRLAAWTRGGTVGYCEPGLRGHLSENGAGEQVPCFDLAAQIEHLPADAELILKIDAEGAEYELLEHLIAHGADKWLTLAWVEWHASSNQAEARRRAKRRKAIEREIFCELVEWKW